MWVGLIQPVEGMNRAKKLKEKELLLPDCLPAGALLFSLPLNSRWNTGSSNLPAWDLNNMISSPESSACPLQLLGLFNLQNWVSQFLLKKSLSIYIALLLFLWRTLIQHSYWHSPILPLCLWNVTHGIYTCSLLPPVFLSPTFCAITLWNDNHLWVIKIKVIMTISDINGNLLGLKGYIKDFIYLCAICSVMSDSLWPHEL